MYEEQTLKVYRECGVKKFPVDVSDVMAKLGFTLVTFSEMMQESDELGFLKNNASDAYTLVADRMVFYNDKKPRRRIRFTLMHELGHVILNTRDEDEADTFAAEILAPQPVIFAKRLRTADEISEYFDVSIPAANNAIVHPYYVPDEAGLRIIDYFGLRESCPWPFNVAIDNEPEQERIRYAMPEPVPICQHHQSKENIYALESRKTEIINRIMEIDCLSENAMERYLKCKEELRIIERRIDYMNRG